MIKLLSQFISDQMISMYSVALAVKLLLMVLIFTVEIITVLLQYVQALTNEMPALVDTLARLLPHPVVHSQTGYGHDNVDHVFHLCSSTNT